MPKQKLKKLPFHACFTKDMSTFLTFCEAKKCFQYSIIYLPCHRGDQEHEDGLIHPYHLGTA
jgi:hypothetical protein